MRYVIPDIKTIAGNHCLFSSMYNAFQKSPLNLSEAEIFFLCNGMDISYKKNSNFKWNILDEEMLKNIAIHTGSEVFYTFEISDDVLERAYEAIRDGNIVILYMNTQNLDYSEIYKKNANREHVIICYGYDIENGNLYICDSYLLDYSGQILTYSGESSLYEIKKGIWGVVWFTHKQTSYMDRNQIIDIAKFNIAKYISDTEVDSKGYFRGISALKAYFEDFEKLINLDDNMFMCMVSEIYYRLRIGNIMHILYYLKVFVQENGQYFKGDSDILINDFESTYNEWRKLLLDIYKSGITLKRNKVSKIMVNARSLIINFQRLITFMLSRM